MGGHHATLVLLRYAPCAILNLDPLYLAAIWHQQGGRCAISGILMVLPPDGLTWERRTRDPWKPSLDRADPTLGYVRGNVRFVTVIANLAKSTFSDADVCAFCRAVVEASAQSRS